MPPLFVYGTLKPGEAAYSKYCAPYVSEATSAYMKGDLFHLPQGYPAMTDGDRWVQGALLQLKSEQAIAQMDAFEDYNPTLSAAENLYTRQHRPVFDRNHQPLGTAWVYLMQRDRIEQSTGILLPNGVWSQQQWPSIQIDE
ncbi:gamma-glutamylcyclotransferase [Oscillatoria sp. CS-180]|uniref:gamma-glutamylcyclotransferase family protein n=1 Tax=Oscillatoria sp. CS-180 TaxID=3021720 RepID=UPI00232C653D|nr:gamma-glutamylcyclotransferase family protein [Oscillatoria sp. CS-180]MDB9526234.1 gamma-glutamylcyclotransferase [Oscillatoria sp. CS-180]